MSGHKSQRELGNEEGFKNAEGLFLNFIQEEVSPQKAAEAIVQLNLKPELLLDVDPKLFELANQLKNAQNEPKPSYLVARYEPYSDERCGYLQGLADAIMIHFNAGDHKSMESLINGSGVLRRELVHAEVDPQDIDDIDDVMNELPDAEYWGQNNGVCTTHPFKKEN